jgi:hypothetical protein
MENETLKDKEILLALDVGALRGRDIEGVTTESPQVDWTVMLPVKRLEEVLDERGLQVR